MQRHDQEDDFDSEYGLDERDESRLPWNAILWAAVLLVGYLWYSETGPFQPALEFNFHDYATEHDEFIAVDVDNRHWQLSNAPRIEAAFRVYGVSFLESGERPPDGPWSIVSHSLLLEPLQVNQAKWAKDGHEENGHSDWTLFTARAASDDVLRDLAELKPVGSRLCAALTARYTELLDFRDDAVAQQPVWEHSCTGHQRCDPNLLIVEAVRAVDCNSEFQGS